jgi:hypothetical protein
MPTDSNRVDAIEDRLKVGRTYEQRRQEAARLFASDLNMRKGATMLEQQRGAVAASSAFSTGPQGRMVVADGRWVEADESSPPSPLDSIEGFPAASATVKIQFYGAFGYGAQKPKNLNPGTPAPGVTPSLGNRGGGGSTSENYGGDGRGGGSWADSAGWGAAQTVLAPPTQQQQQQHVPKFEKWSPDNQAGGAGGKNDGWGNLDARDGWGDLTS